MAVRFGKVVPTAALGVAGLLRCSGLADAAAAQDVRDVRVEAVVVGCGALAPLGCSGRGGHRRGCDRGGVVPACRHSYLAAGSGGRGRGRARPPEFLLPVPPPSPPPTPNPP